MYRPVYSSDLLAGTMKASEVRVKIAHELGYDAQNTKIVAAGRILEVSNPLYGN